MTVSRVAIEIKSLLIGEAATPEELERIRHELATTEVFDEVLYVRTEHRGPEELLVAAKVAVPGDLTAAAIARHTDEAEARIRTAVPSARYIFIEPVVITVELID
jgi:divalent metal cation (Fe/Co/Zn/Cd) transporter